MTVFNDQAHIQIGGQWNPSKSRVERPFRGVLAGVTFNGLRPLDLAASNDPKVQVHGNVNKLDNIPFDYKEQHPELFTKDALKLMIDQIYNDNHHGVTTDLTGRKLILTGEGYSSSFHITTRSLGLKICALDDVASVKVTNFFSTFFFIRK